MLEDLPPDVLGTLLCSSVLSVKDLYSLALTCRALRDAVWDDNRCWRTLVERGKRLFSHHLTYQFAMPPMQ